MTQPNGPIVVCVINLKGGVGKSTISALLARHAYYRDIDVLAVDLDPQANLSQGLMHSAYSEFLASKRPSIVEIFNGLLSPGQSGPGPRPITAGVGVETIVEDDNCSLQLIPSRFDFADNLVGAVRPNPRVLAQYLSAYFAHKDLIIIDCAPTESAFTRAAYHASSKVLVPVKPEFFATIGFPLLQESLSEFRSQNRGHTIEVCGVIINNAFYHGGNDGGPEKYDSLKSIKSAAKKHGWPIFKNEMEHSRGYPKIMRGNYSHSGNASRFGRIASEFFDVIGLG